MVNSLILVCKFQSHMASEIFIESIGLFAFALMGWFLYYLYSLHAVLYTLEN